MKRPSGVVEPIDLPTSNPAARKKSGMHEVVIAAELACERSDRSAEFAFCHDEGFIQFGSSVGAGKHRQVANEIRQGSVELRCGPVYAGVLLVDVRVIVPPADRDHDVPSAPDPP